MIRSYFFELIQVSLGQRDVLTSAPTEEEWEGLYLTAQKHNVLGITYHGVELLSQRGQRPPRKQLLRWYQASEKIRHRNALADSRSHELLSMLSEAGIKGCILKGQGIACYYTDALRGLRQPGDIDAYADCSRERIDMFGREHGMKHVEWNYRHLHLELWKDMLVELHYHIESFYNPFKNRRFQRFVNQNKEMLFSNETEFVAPSLTMNLFHSLLHIYDHVLSSELGFKQLIDYYFLLKKANGHFGSFCQGESLQDVLMLFGLSRFAGGLMWSLQVVTGLESQYLICEPLESEGKLILGRLCSPVSVKSHMRQSPGINDWGIFVFVLKRCASMLRDYPSDALWAPFWFVWHRCWRLLNKLRK